MNQERFKALFEEYLNDTIAHGDLLELQEAIQDSQYQVLFDDLLKSAFKEPAFAYTDDEARQSAFKAINTRINKLENIELENTINKRLIPYRWLAGIAALLFVALGAGWFFLRNNNVKKENIYAHAIKPGINKATLTLSNGKKLILTDVMQGQLASEAGVKISKTKQGQIIYTIIGGDNSGQQPLQYNILTTKRGEQFQVILPDGSHVWLDASSSLRYPVAFNGSERKVELTGQGYFEVAHNAAMPFIVQTAKTEVQVLGTHFNVSAYDDDDGNTKTTLLEGAVRIKTGNGTALLKPGEQAVLNDKGQLMINKDVDVEMEVAWKNGLFDFKKAGIKEIMLNASRWYDINVKYEGKIPETKLTGRMSRNVDLSGLLGILQFEGIRFRVEGKNVIVTDHAKVGS